jgi:hypothetical protein
MECSFKMLLYKRCTILIDTTVVINVKFPWRVFTHNIVILIFLIFNAKIIHNVISCVLYSTFIQITPTFCRNILPPSAAQLWTLMLQILKLEAAFFPESEGQSRCIHDVRTQKITVLWTAGSCECSTLTKCFSRAQAKEREMDETCSTYGEQERCIGSFGWKIWRKGTAWRI